MRPVVQVHSGPRTLGPIAQLGERLICIQEVYGSIPYGSTDIRRYIDVSAVRSLKIEEVEEIKQISSEQVSCESDRVMTTRRK